MAKQGGLGDQAFVHGYDVSGDISALNRISGGPAVDDLTGLARGLDGRVEHRMHGERIVEGAERAAERFEPRR